MKAEIQTNADTCPACGYGLDSGRCPSVDCQASERSLKTAGETRPPFPLPLHIRRTVPGGSRGIFDRQGSLVANVTSEEEAAYFVTAVNNHASLIAALEGVSIALGGQLKDFRAEPWAVQVDEALDRVEGAATSISAGSAGSSNESLIAALQAVENYYKPTRHGSTGSLSTGPLPESIRLQVRDALTKARSEGD